MLSTSNSLLFTSCLFSFSCFVYGSCRLFHLFSICSILKLDALVTKTVSTLCYVESAVTRVVVLPIHPDRIALPNTSNCLFPPSSLHPLYILDIYLPTISGARTHNISVPSRIVYVFCSSHLYVHGIFTVSYVSIYSSYGSQHLYDPYHIFMAYLECREAEANVRTRRHCRSLQ
jgi:hypothetical protein